MYLSERNFEFFLQWPRVPSSAGLLSTMLYTANKPLIGCSQSSPNKGNLLRRVFDYMSIKKCFIYS